MAKFHADLCRKLGWFVCASFMFVAFGAGCSRPPIGSKTNQKFFNDSPVGVKVKKFSPVGDPHGTPPVITIHVHEVELVPATGCTPSGTRVIIWVDKDGNDEPNTEDTNGNGVLDPGEDTNGNGVLDKEPTLVQTTDGGPTADAPPGASGAGTIPGDIDAPDPGSGGTITIRVRCQADTEEGETQDTVAGVKFPRR